MLALSAGVADVEALARARAHLANCTACARMLADIERSARSVAALLPLPAVARVAGLLAAARRVAAVIRHPFAEAGASGVAGGSLAGAGALKVGIAAVCVAGAAGGYAACAHLGVLPGLGLSSRPAAAHRTERHRERAALVPHRHVRFVAPPPSVSLTAVAAKHVVTARRIPAIAQIRLEFGAPSARASSAGASVDHTALVPERTPVATPHQERQTQAEFGFER